MGCTARQGRKAPQEEDLASIDTVLRLYSTGTMPEHWSSSATGRLKGHRRDPSSGSRANRGYPSSARSPPDPLGRTRAPRGPRVPEPRQCLALSFAPTG
jgi:hypothetical protein